MNRPGLATPACLACAGVAPAANAALIQFQSLIEVDGISDPTDVLGANNVGVGSLITLTYTFESTTADATPADPTQGAYVGALQTLELDFEQGPSLILDATPAVFNVMYFVDDYDIGTLIDGYAPDAGEAVQVAKSLALLPHQEKQERQENQEK